MTLKNIADALGITAYPEILDRLTADPSIPDASVINLPLIHSLQKEYDLFGDYYDAVLQGAEDLERDSLRRSWGDAVCRCLPYLSYTERRAVPIPATDKTPAGDMLPLLMLIPLVPSSVEAYRSHGFSEEEIRQLLASYAGAIRTVHNRTGRPGYDKTYYNWMKLYANTRIFLFGGFNFEIKTMPDNVLVLQNRESGALMPLLHQKKIHKSGLILGSAGCKDSDGAFDIAVREDENAYRGYPAENGKILPAETEFPKAVWQPVLRGGEDILSVHIPRGTDLTAERVAAVFADVKEYTKKVFPEYHIQGLFCSSWLLDPSIGKLLGGQSKIAEFGAMYARYPILSAGQEVFSFVFTGHYDSYEDLPENTRLERSLKKLYLDGGFVHAFAGIIV